MKVIQFLMSAPPYNAGETAGFADEQADKFIAMGAARLVGVKEDPASGAPVVHQVMVPNAAPGSTSTLAPQTNVPPAMQDPAQVAAAAAGAEAVARASVPAADTGTVAIPDNWRDLPLTELRALGALLSPDARTKQDAVSAIEAELARREAAAKAGPAS